MRNLLVVIKTLLKEKSVSPSEVSIPVQSADRILDEMRLVGLVKKEKVGRANKYSLIVSKKELMDYVDKKIPESYFKIKKLLGG